MRVMLLLCVCGILASSAAGQDADFTQAFQEPTRGAAVERETRGLISARPGEAAAVPRAELELELADLRKELAESQRRNDEINRAMDALAKELIQLKQAADKPVAVATRRAVRVATAQWCGVCHAWADAAKADPGTVEKRFLDVEQSRPADIPPEEWAAVLGVIRAKGGTLPVVWWRDKSGTIRTLVGRYSDAQLTWSMDAADAEVDRAAAPVRVRQVPVRPMGPIALGR